MVSLTGSSAQIQQGLTQVIMSLTRFMECVHSAFLIHFFYSYAAADFNNPEGIATIVWLVDS